MAFVTQGSGENPLDGVDDGMYDFDVTSWGKVENRFKGKLYREDLPEGENNQRNNYDFQWELGVTVHTGEDQRGDVEAKIWANPTTGEKSKLRKLMKALGAWETREIDGKPVEGFDDDEENIVGRKGRALVQEGKIDSFLKAK